jgi:hypothetical protein
MTTSAISNLAGLRNTLEASWDEMTSYQGAVPPGNPAFGQCYPTSWLLQQLDPRIEIARGTVEVADRLHIHYWNVLPTVAGLWHLDLTWDQFAPGARVQQFELLHRERLNDSAATVARRDLLLRRVNHMRWPKPPARAA